MPFSEIYVPLSVAYPRDPKIRALMYEHGQDGVFAAYLYIMMCLYCRENLTDGWVPLAEVPALAYPLDKDLAMQLASWLHDVCLVSASSARKVPALQVLAYVKRNGTRQDVERATDQRRYAARTRWAVHPASGAHSSSHSSSQCKDDASLAGARAVAETESKTDLSPVAEPDAREVKAEREIDLPSITQHEIRTLTGGLQISRERAAQIVAEVIGDRHLNSPAAYLRSALRAHPDLFTLAEPAATTTTRRRRNTAADQPAAAVNQAAATVDGRARAAPATDEQRKAHAEAARAALAAKQTKPADVVPLPDDPGDAPF